MKHQRLFPTIALLAILSACAEPPADTSLEEVTVRDLRGDEFTYEIDGQPYIGYVAYDANSSGSPGVLVVHQWWGHDEYVRMRADMLAEMGYTALALDMYGGGKTADHPESAQTFAMEVLSNLNAGAERFAAALDTLKRHPSTDSTMTAAIGYCFGGAIVLEMARRGFDLDAVASFHGILSTPTRADSGSVQAKILVLHGADDPFVPQEQVDAFKDEMDSAGVDMRFVAYPGVVHAFTDTSATRKGEAFNMPLRYDAYADSASWAELSAFMAEVFGEGWAGD